MDYSPKMKEFATKAIHTGQEPENWKSMCLVPPLVMSTVFKLNEKYFYSREGNPTREVLEKCLASIEDGKYGFCFASGSGAVTAVISMFKSGDHFICGDQVYGGVNELFRNIAKKFGMDTTFVDCSDIEELEKAIKPNTKMIFIETPTNPKLNVFDIKAISVIKKKHGLIFVVDNTFLTSYFQKPLILGADLSLYSVSKYVAGHGDIIMGAIVTNDDILFKKLHYIQKTMGIIPSPFDCSQVIRSLKTLDIRMEKHSKNGFAVARFLETHPKVKQVLHPLLPSHPQYELSKKQTSGHSGIISFYFNGDGTETTNFLKHLKIITHAGSLGDSKSLVCLPISTSHFSLPEDEKKKLQITDNLVRLSVGLEDVNVLIEDLKQALDSCSD